MINHEIYEGVIELGIVTSLISVQKLSLCCGFYSAIFYLFVICVDSKCLRKIPNTIMWLMN